MKTVTKGKKNPSTLKPSEKKLIDRAAKKIVKDYGKTIKLLAKE